MTDSEVRAFLLTGTRTGKVATVQRDGRPHVVPVWFVVDDDGSILFTAGEGTAKAKAMRDEARIALCVDDENPPYGFVLVEGRAEIGDDLDEMLPWATRIGARYMGPDRSAEFGRRNAVRGELLVRLRPDRVIAIADMTG